MTSSESPKHITRTRAEEIAERVITESAGNHDLVIQPEKTLERPFGWVFFYTTRKYLTTHDPNYLLPGDGPLAVDRDGAHEFLPSSIGPDRAIALHEKKWEERTHGAAKLR